ncbi:MAG: hypothetical protein ACE15C_01945 [Phycisphaerae bacterium]
MAVSEKSGTAFREPSAFRSQVVDRMRAEGNIWQLPGGRLVLPRVFGFCRGVERALAMLEEACSANEAARLPTPRSPRPTLFLLGQIIHNPWVNEHFRRRGVVILSEAEIARLEQVVTPADCAVIPAFGVRPEVRRRLAAIGCRVVDTSCGDVRRLWAWARRAAGEGYGVMIFGRARHDETVVTKSILDEAGGKYVVAGDLEQVRRFCELLGTVPLSGTVPSCSVSDPSGGQSQTAGQSPMAAFAEVFGREATNATSIEPFFRLAQVSQTTMLYDETMVVRRMVREAFERRFGAEMDSGTVPPSGTVPSCSVRDGSGGQSQTAGLSPARLVFQPTVCRATQDRQAAAVELCRSGCDLVVVVGGFGSSNTRHLHELARQYAPAYFIEDAGAIVSASELRTADPDTGTAVAVRDWLPGRRRAAGERPLTIAVLAGASTPECVVGEVLQRLAGFLQ